ncbi:MAG TPA: hypothetical protein VE291_08485 [Terracidiphilus sp.]|jgi:hypothetical protein|nr:hypothetical protein [Terracidiphilus sp.]
MIPELRQRFNAAFTAEAYAALKARLARETGAAIEFRMAETPVFVEESFLDGLAHEGAALTKTLLADRDYLAAARRAIPAGYAVAGETAHPHFLTADFALVREPGGQLAPRLVELQAFPSIFGFQAQLSAACREVFGLPRDLGYFLGGLDEAGYWDLLRRIIVGRHDPENVVLTEIDPLHQKTLPDFQVTAQKLGIAVVDIASLRPVGNRLHYRDAAGRLVPIHRIYNRAIADEMIAKRIALPFDLAHNWEVEWAGHPNWYFLISKFAVPFLAQAPSGRAIVPPAVFLDDFLAGPGRERLAAAGVALSPVGPETVHTGLLLKPLFSFAGKGIVFGPTQAELEAISAEHRRGFLLQQRMHFAPTVETPHGMTQAEFRILYGWPDGGELIPAICLVRLGRGRMMGVDHNRDLQWVGSAAALFPNPPRQGI